MLGRVREVVGQQLGEVICQLILKLWYRRKLLIGSDVFVANATQQILERSFPLGRGLLDVDQSRFAAREPVLVFQPGDIHRVCNYAVALPVDADENVALSQVGSVNLASGIRACAGSFSVELMKARRR